MRLRPFLLALLMPMAAMTQSVTKPTPGTTSQLEPLRLGQMKVWTIQDGQLSLDGSLLKGIDPADTRRMLGGKAAALTPVNAYLIRLNGKTVLVDTGLGKNPEADSGHLLEQLETAGVSPSDIDLIFITHYHFDHIGGLVKADGTRVFPKAQLLVPRSEHAYWMQDPAKLPERLRERIPKLKALFSVYQQAKAFREFEDGEALVSGIRAVAAQGHTGGHTIYVFSSEGHELWCLGDLIHFGAVQFERPEVGVSFDSNGAEAVAIRQSLFRMAAQSKAVLAGAHLPQLVYIEAKGTGYVAIPVSQK
jgi:glyoxylase-like metal-dependent hydrolase (beta-lactamase superfamily II)